MRFLCAFAQSTQEPVAGVQLEWFVAKKEPREKLRDILHDQRCCNVKQAGRARGCIDGCWDHSSCRRGLRYRDATSRCCIFKLVGQTLWSAYSYATVGVSRDEPFHRYLAVRCTSTIDYDDPSSSRPPSLRSSSMSRCRPSDSLMRNAMTSSEDILLVCSGKFTT